jgi:hypothetical protein
MCMMLSHVFHALDIVRHIAGNPGHNYDWRRAIMSYHAMLRMLV